MINPILFHYAYPTLRGGGVIIVFRCCICRAIFSNTSYVVNCSRQTPSAALVTFHVPLLRHNTLLVPLADNVMHFSYCSLLSSYTSLSVHCCRHTVYSCLQPPSSHTSRTVHCCRHTVYSCRLPPSSHTSRTVHWPGGTLLILYTALAVQITTFVAHFSYCSLASWYTVHCTRRTDHYFRRTLLMPSTADDDSNPPLSLRPLLRY